MFDFKLLAFVCLIGVNSLLASEIFNQDDSTHSASSSDKCRSVEVNSDEDYFLYFVEKQKETTRIINESYPYQLDPELMEKLRSDFMEITKSPLNKYSKR